MDMEMISRREFVKKAALGSAAAVALGNPLFGSAPAPAGETRFGVNYVPRKRWWYCWLDWDQQSITDDLNGIAELGLDHIRIQCLWPMFQPGIGSVSDRALANLHSLLDAADNAGLDVEVTVLNGWMSGLWFLPPFVAPLPFSDQKDGNIFTSPRVIEAEKLLFSRIAETIGTHRRLLGFDLGNEIDVLLQIPSCSPASMDDADAWAREIFRHVNEIAPGKFHVNGISHAPWFNDFGFSREQIATTGQASIIHSYLDQDGVLSRYKYSDPPVQHIAEFEIELAYAYHTDLNRRVWVEETSVMPEILEGMFYNIIATGKAWGITWWCSHDIEQSIGLDQGETEMGLLDLKNKPKPMGKKLAQLIADFKRSRPGKATRNIALVIPDRGLSTKAWPADWKYATPYMNLINRGLSPAIVLESRSTDEDYLRARGITELIRSTK